MMDCELEFLKFHKSPPPFLPPPPSLFNLSLERDISGTVLYHLVLYTIDRIFEERRHKNITPPLQSSKIIAKNKDRIRLNRKKSDFFRDLMFFRYLYARNKKQISGSVVANIEIELETLK